ncbi:MAG: ABC transporter permease [Verrucomicrobia bacterium]|nr:ABC transporter permease [Verrucomicrobiota bacterium]
MKPASGSALQSAENTGTRKNRVLSLVLRQDFLLLVFFIGMTGVFSAFNPRFFSIPAAANILQDFSPVVLMAIGQTFVIASGGIDLSVGSTLGLSGVMMALVIRTLNEKGFDPSATIVFGLGAAIAVGGMVGLTNGLLISYVRIVPFIATLATMGAAAGMSLVVTGGVQIAGAPTAVILIGNVRYFGIFTVPVMAVLVILIIAWVALSLTRFGRWTYAIGSNLFASRAAGINVQKHFLKIYALSGVLAALAGAFVYFRLASGSPLSGRGGELSAIAAAVIGGVSLQGGVGRLTGAVLGALITTSILSGLILVGVEPNWQQIVVATLTAIAVGVQGLGRIANAQ